MGFYPLGTNTVSFIQKMNRVGKTLPPLGEIQIDFIQFIGYTGLGLRYKRGGNNFLGLRYAATPAAYLSLIQLLFLPPLASFRNDTVDELAFAFCVAVDIPRVLAGKGFFQLAVSLGLERVRSQVVAEIEHALDLRMAQLKYVDIDDAGIAFGPGKKAPPRNAILAIGFVTAFDHLRVIIVDAVYIVDDDEKVEDRLGFNSSDGGAARVMDRNDFRLKNRRQLPCFCLVKIMPGRVVRNEHDLCDFFYPGFLSVHRSFGLKSAKT
jgi:hypothetical protein